MENELEKKVRAAYEAKGWTVLRDGWPDFLCIRKRADGTIELSGVEVKSKNDLLRDNQKKMLASLSTVMEVKEVREGSGYGDNLKCPGMHVLDYYMHRFENHDHGDLWR